MHLFFRVLGLCFAGAVWGHTMWCCGPTAGSQLGISGGSWEFSSVLQRYFWQCSEHAVRLIEPRCPACKMCIQPGQLSLAPLLHNTMLFLKEGQ